MVWNSASVTFFWRYVIIVVNGILFGVMTPKTHSGTYATFRVSLITRSKYVCQCEPPVPYTEVQYAARRTHTESPTWYNHVNRQARMTKYQLLEINRAFLSMNAHWCWKEGNVLFNDALNTFHLRLYGVRHMVRDHSDSERENPLPPRGLLFMINSKGSFIFCTIPQTG